MLTLTPSSLAQVQVLLSIGSWLSAWTRGDSVMYLSVFFFSSRRRHTRCSRDWSSDVCSSDLSSSVHSSRPTWQLGQVLSDAKNEPMTNWPGLMEVTTLPASSTMPQYSCPIGVGWAIGWTPRYGHKSDPHTHVAEILMMASVGLMIFGVSRSSKRTSRGP